MPLNEVPKIFSPNYFIPISVIKHQEALCVQKRETVGDELFVIVIEFCVSKFSKLNSNKPRTSIDRKLT